MKKIPFAIKQQGFSLLILAAILTQGPILACLNPSFYKMATAQPMACCAHSCKMETTEETAQKACNTTKTVFHQNKGITGALNEITKTAVNPEAASFLTLSPSYAILAFNKDQTPHPYSSVPLYILSHFLLI